VVWNDWQLLVNEKLIYTKHRWSLLHHHDLVSGCSIHDIPGSDQMTDEQRIDALVAFELNDIKED